MLDNLSHNQNPILCNKTVRGQWQFIQCPITGLLVKSAPFCVKSAPIFSYCKCVKSAPFCAKSAPFCVKSAPFCVKSAPFLCQICTFFVSNLHHLCQICTFCVKSAPFLLYNILNYILALAGGHYKYKTFALAPAGSCRPNLTQHKDVLHQIFLGFFERKKVQI